MHIIVTNYYLLHHSVENLNPWNNAYDFPITFVGITNPRSGWEGTVEISGNLLLLALSMAKHVKLNWFNMPM